MRGACEARSRIAAACDAALAAEPSTATATPRWRNEAACSAISAISGEITTVTPCETSAGSWKQMDLPPPVGTSTSASPPPSTRRITLSCGARNARWPNVRRSTASKASVGDVVVSSPGEGEDDDSATARCCGAGAGPSQASQRARVAAFSSMQRAHVHGAVSATLTTFRFFGITAGLFPLNTAFHGEARFAMFVFE